MKPALVNHVHQGDFVVGDSSDLMLTTVLGSCVAACIHDPTSKVGGMNHFLLPASTEGSLSEGKRYGVHLMELLLNGLLKAGARRDRLKAKLFGGARMIEGLSDIGARNAEFALRFLRDEGIEVVGHSLRGTQARRIQYWPASGQSRQKLLGDAVAIPTATPRLRPTTFGDVDLF